jgi:hypothetical protein
MILSFEVVNYRRRLPIFTRDSRKYSRLLIDMPR